MKDKIKPYLIDITVDSMYQDPETDPFGSKQGNRWCVYASVDIGDKNVLDYVNEPSKPWRKYPKLLGKKYNPNGSLGYLFGLTICSPSYKADPRSDQADEVEKALVLDVYDLQEAKKIINARLSEVDELGIDDLSGEISSFLDTNELDYQPNNLV